MNNRLVVVGFMITPGVLLVAYGGFVIWDQWQAVERYQPVDAEIRSAGVTGDAVPVVTYRYTVNGFTSTSKNVFPGTGRQGGPAISEVVNRY